MKVILNFLRLQNTMSVDVALGATASSIFFSIVFQTPISILGLTSLGLSVWIIYTADHLLDVRNPKTSIRSTRHAFHQKSFRQLKWVLATGVIIDFALVCQLPSAISYAGAVLAAIVAAYLVFNKRLGASKELMAALFYTSGVCLPALVFVEQPIEPSQRLLIIQFFISALTNLLLFAVIEIDEDKANKFTSIATLKGVKQVSFLLVILFVVSIGLFFKNQQIAHSWKPSSILILMEVILAFLFAFQKTDFVKNYYRLIGDGVFLLPCLVLIG